MSKDLEKIDNMILDTQAEIAAAQDRIDTELKRISCRKLDLNRLYRQKQIAEGTQ